MLSERGGAELLRLPAAPYLDTRRAQDGFARTIRYTANL